MSQLVKEYEAVDIGSVRSIRGHMYSKLRRSRNKIPEQPGIYIWRYWPNFRDLDSESLIEALAEMQSRYPQQTENLFNSRIQIDIKKTPFGLKNSNDILGVKNQNKIEMFLKAIKAEEDVRQVLVHVLEILLSFSPPLYIGKADNLRNRLGDHFDNKTPLLGQLDKSDIPHDEIFISYVIDDLTMADTELTTNFEEILQRITNPPFVKRYG